MSPADGPTGPTAPPHASLGERVLQQRHGTAEVAAEFYDRQVHDHLTPAMRAFVSRQSMLFLATADGLGACDATFRAGPRGFAVPLGAHGLTFPEYRGNGVKASAGNLMENPQLSVLFMDFTEDHIGLHINGRARLVPDDEQRARYPHLPVDTAPGRAPEAWVDLLVDDAYVHCSRHIPHLVPAPRTRPRPDRPADAAYFPDAGSGAGSGAAAEPSDGPVPVGERTQRGRRGVLRLVPTGRDV